MERVPHHDGPETVLELLNRPEGFFAFRPAEDDEILLVSKVQTVSLSVDRQRRDPAGIQGADGVAVGRPPGADRRPGPPLGGADPGPGIGTGGRRHAGRMGERGAAGAARAAARLLEHVPGSVLRRMEPRRDPLREPRLRPVRAPPELRSPAMPARIDPFVDVLLREHGDQLY